MDTSKNYYDSVMRDFHDAGFQTYGLAALLNSTVAMRPVRTKTRFVNIMGGFRFYNGEDWQYYIVKYVL